MLYTQRQVRKLKGFSDSHLPPPEFPSRSNSVLIDWKNRGINVVGGVEQGDNILSFQQLRSKFDFLQILTTHIKAVCRWHCCFPY